MSEKSPIVVAIKTAQKKLDEMNMRERLLVVVSALRGVTDEMTITKNQLIDEAKATAWSFKISELYSQTIGPSENSKHTINRAIITKAR